MTKKRTLWEQADVGFYEPVKFGRKIKWNVKLSKNSGFFTVYVCNGAVVCDAHKHRNDVLAKAAVRT